MHCNILIHAASYVENVANANDDGVHKMSCETGKVTIIADITKCAGSSCRVKESCYRYTPLNQVIDNLFL
jgi:hypothetical protein